MALHTLPYFVHTVLSPAPDTFEHNQPRSRELYRRDRINSTNDNCIMGIEKRAAVVDRERWPLPHSTPPATVRTRLSFSTAEALIRRTSPSPEVSAHALLTSASHIIATLPWAQGSAGPEHSHCLLPVHLTTVCTSIAHGIIAHSIYRE